MPRPNDPVFVKPEDQFGGDETGCGITPDDLRGLLFKVLSEFPGPQGISKQFRDEFTLRVILMVGNKGRGGMTEIAANHKCAIAFHIRQCEAKESAFCFEIADLQGTANLRLQARSVCSQLQLAG
ncbi:hypothetical protein D3C76_1455430 [compost metagenome]